ncbi:ATP-binding protein [Thermodesulfobacteriota bacterium]
MRIGKLYIKIFLSFIVVLVITEIIIFALFLIFPGRYFRSRIIHHTKAKVLIVKEVIEDKIKSSPYIPLAENSQLRDFIGFLGDTLEAKVWLQKSDGSMPITSFYSDLPESVKLIKHKRVIDFGTFRLYHDSRPKRSHWFYAIIPVGFSGEEAGTVHVLFDKERPPHPEGRFGLGLAIVGLIIALLVIPVSRFITKPLKKLSRSALLIADGDLSHRAKVKSRDEIGELCSSLNHMADSLERMIKGGKELTANISHELRTPLTRIRIAEELIREKLEQGNRKELERHLDDIREDIEELDRLIGRILELSMIDIHESPLKFETFNPSDLLIKLMDRLKPLTDQKDQNIKTDLSFHSLYKGDIEALGTAILNILENAVKFTGERGDITVKVYSEGDFLEISVTNSYEELTEEDLSMIFDPFHRVGRSSESGSGLGLAISKKIIERHDGNIEARNSPEGLEILIRLPIKPLEG